MNAIIWVTQVKKLILMPHEAKIVVNRRPITSSLSGKEENVEHTGRLQVYSFCTLGGKY